MSQTEDKTFFKRANDLIAAANVTVGEVPPPRVASSTAFAAARFNAWVCFVNAKTPEEMKRRRDEAITAFAEEYRRMFADNFDDYLENFDAYRTTPAP